MYRIWMRYVNEPNVYSVSAKLYAKKGNAERIAKSKPWGNNFEYRVSDEKTNPFIVDAEKDTDMKSLSPEEAISILSDLKINIPVPKAAVTQRKRNAALDMAIDALKYSELPNSKEETK